MTRFVLPSLFAALLLAPIAASAQAPAAPAPATPAPAASAPSAPAAKAPMHKAAPHHTMHHMAMKSGKPAHQTATAAGDRAVDKLNEQSLARARSGDSAPASTPK